MERVPEDSEQPPPCPPTYSLSWIVRRRHRYRLAVAFIIAVIFFCFSHHIFILAYSYRDYAFALLPDPPLPVQRRTVPHTHIPREPDARVPRVMCLIVTSPKYHGTRSSHVAATWARHCTRAVFLSSANDPRLPEVYVTPGAASYDELWGKVTQGFEWAYDQHLHSFDFIIKADDDTFLVVENLQAALQKLDPGRPLATGVQLRTWDTDSTYLNGGAGYVLSRGAVKTLVERGLRGKQCGDNLDLGTNEDVNMAKCLTHLGVVFLDSRDSLGRQRFHMYPPHEVIDPRQANSLTHLWLKRKSVFPYKFGYAELSDEAISFHYVDARSMYLLYYLVYVVNPHNQINPIQPIEYLEGGAEVEKRRGVNRVNRSGFQSEVIQEVKAREEASTKK